MSSTHTLVPGLGHGSGAGKPHARSIARLIAVSYLNAMRMSSIFAIMLASFGIAPAKPLDSLGRQMSGVPVDAALLAHAVACVAKPSA